MKGALAALITGAVLLAGANVAASSEPAGEVSLRHCSGKVRISSASFGWRVRVKRMTCDRAEQLIGDIPEDHGFRCEYTERWRGIRSDCRKHSAAGTRRLIYLDSGY